MAAALVGCKIMKEMAHLATEAETARSMKNAKYEQFAMGENHTTTKQRTQSIKHLIFVEYIFCQTTW